MHLLLELTTVAQQLDKVQLDRLRAMLNADAAKEKQETEPKPKYKSPYMALYLDEQALLNSSNKSNFLIRVCF